MTASPSTGRTHAGGHAPDGEPDAPSGDGDEGAYDIRYAWRALSVVSLASIFSGLNQSTLNIALPTVVRHFGASSTEASWIVVVFSLVTTSITLACGRLADVMGRRSMYLLGLGLFTVTSLLLGFSVDVQMLLVLRVIQAVAGAMLVTNSATIVSSAFPPSMLSRGLGVYMAGFSVAQLLGPTVGGALATSLGWRWVFWFNVPVGALCLVWGSVTLRKVPSKHKVRGFDVFGNVLLVLGLGGLIIALSDVSSSGWGSAVVRSGLILSLVFLPTFVWWEARARLPLLDITLFRNRVFSMAILAGLVNSIARSSVLVIIALYLQSALGKTPLEAGLALLPMAATNAIIASTVPFFTSRMLPRTVSAIGAAITTCGLATLFFATGSLAGLGPVWVGLILTGMGSGIFQPSNITSILEGTPEDQVGITNAVRITVQNTANLIGMAIALTLMSSPLTPALRHALFAGTASTMGHSALRELASGYQLAFGVMAAVSSLAVLTSLASRSVYKRAAAEASGPR
ncbi:MAG: MFS transporter [Frankiaceae bacterium]|nr:MFS transporter [Frankiaceae bacterium]